MSYRILKKLPSGSEVFVNDSDGTPMEWSSMEEAIMYQKLYQKLTKHNSEYVLVNLSSSQEKEEETA